MRFELRWPGLLMSAIALALAGCGSSSASGISDGRIVAALKLTTQGGAYAMDKNPAFCAVAKLLNDSGEVRAAAKASGDVIASRDGTVGIQVVTPFSKHCESAARKQLDKLARKG